MKHLQVGSLKIVVTVLKRRSNNPRKNKNIPEPTKKEVQTRQSLVRGTLISEKVFSFLYISNIFMFKITANKMLFLF